MALLFFQKTIFTPLYGLNYFPGVHYYDKNATRYISRIKNMLETIIFHADIFS
jgi:hypothetical protein